MFRRLVLIAVLVSSTFCQTPVIGGTCKLGTADVQIGGKQTQFFLKCETTADSAQGEGVWVVKSRAAATAAAATSSSSAAAAAAAPSVVPVENTQPQQHPKARKPVSPNICEQDNGARENEACAVSATCLQAHNELPSSYLQCDQAGLRWIRKSCQDGFIFNFEQQTCIVPKRMSSLSQSVSDDPCLKCSLGSACRHGVCYPLTTSNLCSDGSPPNGTCSTIKKCPNQHFCTAQNVCCPQTALSSSIGCQLVCRIDEDREDQCPHGFSCQNNCCEPRKILRHPISRQEDGFYDGGGVENQVSSSSIQLESCAQKSPDFSTKCGGTNANCSSDDDCPTSFKCDKFACCRLAICPRTDTPARFTCTNQYHCRSNERCIFGACCPNFSDAAQPSNQSIGVVGSTPIIRQQSVASASCDVDDRVKYCDIEHVCPEMSECIAGICCRLPPMSKCGNGLMALSIPARCQLSDECPIASRCEYGKCCPFETESQTNDDDVVDDENQQLEILETNEVVVEEASTTSSPKGISIRKSTCLTSHQCDLHQLCPPQFTCSLAGKCCDLKVLCPDGTVPESSCNHHDNCPSSSHKCLLLNNEHRACCYMPQLRTTDDSTSDSSSDCPAGSKEVDPKFGASCRYSLQCPSPYFCQQATGLVCTFSSCSNSNPCSVGTCNNGYCCSSNSNSAPAIINNVDRKRRRRSISSLPTTTTTTTTTNPLDMILHDFPIGPPGYGFPEHLANLDEVLVKATGDGASCAAGFSSSLVCSIESACPPGLHCDMAINLCCPLILPLTDRANPKRRKSKRRHQEKATDDVVIKSRFNSMMACECMASGSSNNCVGCQSAPQVIAIPTNTCPGGGYSVGGCSSGYCATGYTCVQNQCCPSYSSAPRISVYSCPSGGSAVGACINGRCASGYRCHNNGCCPQATTQNPFVCPDGTQAAGGCVNGQCGSGYTCSNGLCCAGTSTTVKCLDGSDAVGACIPSCQGDGCGGVQVSYYCGSGYTCTTGNICCPVNSCPNGGEPLGPTINGLCPTGYTVQGSLCCSATCSDGSTGTEPVNGVCPSGFTLENGVCCGSSITCSDEISIGPCTTGVNNGCPAGYACDMNGVNCCPVVDYQSDSCIIGTAVGGLCPPGYTVVYIPNSPLIENGVNPGTCVDVQCTTGICPATEQISDCDANTGACPSGYSCFENALVCCSTNTFSRLRVAKGRKSTSPKLNYGRPLNSYMPPKPTFGGSSSCSDGSISSGPCINGLCGIGLECQNGKCCQEGSTNRGLESKCPSGDTAVSGCFPNGSCGTGFECVAALNLCCPPGQPSTSSSGFGQLVGGGSGGGGGGVASVRPIGARCQFDSECVSHHEGLSMCHAGVCQCSPIAFSQGIACIRRKSFQMNDEPMKNDDNVAINDDTDDKKKSSANTIV